MIQREVGRYRLQPSRRLTARSDLGEAFEGTQEDRLCHVFGVGLPPEQAHGSRKHHVLIFAHERLEPGSVGHAEFGEPPAVTTSLTREEAESCRLRGNNDRL